MSKSKEAATAGNVILKYLNEQNRPYSTQDVFSNLQREHGLGKTIVVKAMELLAQQGKIKEKVYGKQKIYFANQDQFCSMSDADLKDLDSKIAELSGELRMSQQSCRQLESELKDLIGSMTTEELVKETTKLKEECAGYQNKLEKIKSSTDHVTPEEKEKVYSERKQFCKEWRKRKRMAVEIFDAILEGYPKSKKQFFEEVGVETDEDHNVTVPDV